MTMLRGGFSHALSPVFRKVAFDEYGSEILESSKIFNFPSTPARAYIDEARMVGLGTLRLKPESAPTPYEDLAQGPTRRQVWDTFGLGFAISMELVADDMHRIFGAQRSKWLGESARNNKEIMAFSLLNNGFNTAFPGFTTGEALFSAAHVTSRGGSLSNLGSADLSLISLQAALESFHSMTNEAGMPRIWKPKWLVHSIGNHWIANQLLKSNLLPGTNQNDINQVAREGLQPLLVHYLTDPDAWFLVADKHDLNLYERQKFTFSSTDNFRTKDMEFMGLCRRGVGWGEWRGIWGSPGA